MPTFGAFITDSAQAFLRTSLAGRLRGHPLFRLLPVRLQDCTPLNAFIVEETICRHRFAPAVTRLWHARRRCRRHTFRQCPRLPVQARIAQVELLKLRVRPCSRLACHLRHAKDESKRDFASLYKGGWQVIESKLIFSTTARLADLCITSCTNTPPINQQTPPQANQTA